MRRWFSLALSLCSVAALAAQTSQPTALTPNTPVAATLSAGQNHVYEISLQAGDFVVVSVRKTMDRPLIIVADPTGRERLVASWIDPSIVADANGRYRVTLSPNRNGAPSGDYEVVVSVRRPATTADLARATGDRLMHEARVRLAQPGADSRPAAITTFSAALSSFSEAGYRTGEMWAHLMLGDSYNALNADPSPAREHLRAAQAIAHELGDDAREGDALQGIASSYRVAVERPTSLQYAQEALKLYERAGDRVGQAGILNNMGRALNDMSEYATALEYFDRALVLSKAAGDRGNVPRIYLNRGQSFTSMGRLPEALDSYTLARSALKGTGNDELESMLLNNTGIAYKNLGDYRRALASYDEAIAAFRHVGNAFAEAQLLNNIGNIYQLLEEYPQSLDHYNQALAIARRIGQRGVEASALNNIGTTYARMGDYARALDHHQQSMKIRQAQGDRSGEASCLNQAGLDWYKLGELDKADEALRTALEMRHQLNEATSEADTLLNLAAVERTRGDAARARTTIEAALTRTESLRASITDANLRASYIAHVEDTYSSYVDILMQSHEQSPTAGHDREALHAAERSRARVLLESLMETRGDLREGVDPALLAQEKSQQRKLDAASAQVSQLLTRRASEADMTAGRNALDAADREYQQLRARIRASSPHYAALTQPEPLTVTDIQQRVLDDATVLLEFSLGESRSWLWAVTPGRITSVALPPRDTIAAAARAFYDEVTARQPRAGESSTTYATRIAASDRRLRDRAAALSTMLFGGVAADLEGTWRGKRLAIVGAGALEYLPFAALPVPSARATSSATTTSVPLIARHEIVEMPSASVLDTLRRETAGRRRPAHELAVLADPVFEASDPRVTNSPAASGTAAGPASDVPYAATRSVERFDAVRGNPLTRLPFSREEAMAIAALAPKSDTLNAVDFQASRATALGGTLADYRIVHFATHGLIDSERPDLSGLVLSLVNDRGVAQDGFLRLTDIYNLKLNASLVVLSACQTALGKEIRGEGLVGLTRGFMYAGAPRVVASLWQVSDLATAELMKKFYAGMLQQKLAPAAALRAAQLELSKDPRWQAPYYWAGFVLEGDWR